MISLVDLHKSFWTGPVEGKVLKGINLTIQRGDFFSIMGPSGCGKSTVMNIVGLLDRPTSGSYYLDGKLVEYDDDDHLSQIRNRTIGFVFQQYHLLSKLTVAENVGIPLMYRGASEEAMRARSLEMLKKVGMADKANHRPLELSGGQQQRVAIARALAGRPLLILADEPTGALDVKVGQEIMDLFRQLNEEENITFILITHNPEVAEQCSRRAEMRNGVLVEE